MIVARFSSRSSRYSHILTEETQQGLYWESRVQKVPDGLWKAHQKWVEALSAIAEADAERART